MHPRHAARSWRALRAEVERQASGPQRAAVVRFLATRQDAWELMVRGLRANDTAVVEQAVGKLQDAERVLQALEAAPR